jgi:hypothetical protein
MQKSTNPKIIRKIQSIGISTFINYYYLFKAQKNEKDNEIIFESFRQNNEPWNENSFNTKASHGKSIFNHGYEKQALEYIVFNTNVNKIGIKVHEMALDIYKSEFN